MPMSIKKNNSRTTLDEISEDGELKRAESAWRNWISSEGGAQFPPEKDRYHLFVSYACPWAHRALIVRALKGLEDVISYTVVHPTWRHTAPDIDEHMGWVFGNPEGVKFIKDSDPEPFFNSTSVRELYDRAGDTNGKYTVPILWDTKLNTIVSNESSEIIRMLNSDFNEFAKNPDLDLYAKQDRVAIDAVNGWIYPSINNGVYRCGFATSQEAYDKAIDELTISFDRIDGILQKQRYIAGNQLTEADIRLFVTLVRFDEVYVVYFKTNTRSVASTPSILNYCRQIYQLPGVAETVHMEHIKTHYYTSHPHLNKFAVIPRGNNFEALLKDLFGHSNEQ